MILIERVIKRTDFRTGEEQSMSIKVRNCVYQVFALKKIVQKFEYGVKDRLK